jgi:hypothetical protein
MESRSFGTDGMITKRDDYLTKIKICPMAGKRNVPDRSGICADRK